MKITKEEYEEYQQLKRWAKREKVFASARSIEKLEDDIDTPIKKCVAMLALLGCEPLYSCCGFDYTNQPFHKSHQYGRPYIILKPNEHTLQVFYNLSIRKSRWIGHTGADNRICFLELMAGMNPHWRKEECIHFAEECVSEIYWLENFLRGARECMVDSIVLEDTNFNVKNAIENWQYPPKKPWAIRKEEILS